MDNNTMDETTLNGFLSPEQHNNTIHGMISLDEWNADLVSKLLPDAVILMVYLVIGSLGNTLVIYIHLCRLKENFEDRYFIPALAIADLAACVSNTCFSFSINLLPVKYSNDLACKFMWFICVNTTCASALMLVIIAVQRYLKICRPFGGQMTEKWKRVALGLMVLVCLLLAFPCFFFYGSRDVVHRSGTVGKRCTNVRGPWSKTEPLIYKTAVTLVIVSVIVSLIVFYSLIARVVRRSSRFRKAQTHAGKPSSSNISFTNDTRETSLQDNMTTKSPGNTEAKLEIHKEYTSEDISFSKEGIKEIKKTNSEAPKTRISGLRLSIIFMLISVIFILSYVPKAAMMVWESKKEDFWTDLTRSEIGIYRFLYTFFIVNNIVNPFIYGFFDRRFRTEFFSLLRGCQKR